jgi:3-oxoadipate enol-lactonase
MVNGVNVNRNGLEEKVLAGNSYDVHYYVAGPPEGELIVCLHPAFADHQSFGRQFEYFAGRYRVLALDMVGHGRSQIRQGRVTIDATLEHVAEMMALENKTSCHLVGVSMGSLITQALAARYPEKVKTLTVVGSYDIFGDRSKIERANLSVMLKVIFWLLVSKKRFRRVSASFVAIQPEAQALFDRGAAAVRRRSLLVLPGMNNLMPKEEKSVYHPLLIVVGDQELELVQKTSAAWHEGDPASRFHVIPNAGHCANMDNAPAFNEILDYFIEDNE